MQEDQEKLEITRAVQSIEKTLALIDLQNPNTVLIWNPNQTPPLSRQNWSQLEKLVCTNRDADPEAINDFLSRAKETKLRAHMQYREFLEIEDANDRGIAIKTLVLPMNALLTSNYYWVEVVLQTPIA